MSRTTIYIKKINEKESCIFYAVSKPFQDVEFCIAIDKDSATIYFFKPDDPNKAIGKVCINNSNNLKEIQGLDIRVSNLVIIQATKAFLNNAFSDDISWCP